MRTIIERLLEGAEGLRWEVEFLAEWIVDPTGQTRIPNIDRL
jgi:hypothetical protein